MSLIGNAADYFKSRQTMVERWFSDDQGRFAFRVTVAEVRFIVTAKKYLKDGQASFMADKVVQRAIDSHAYILLFTSDDRKLVFDPNTVKRAGTPDTAAEADRRRRGESWVDVDADLSAPFMDVVDGVAEPPTVATIDAPESDELADY